MYIKRYGYIDTEGNFYECAVGEHSILCERLGVDNPEENDGWVKIYCAGAKGVDYYSRRVFLTVAQYKTLIDLGIALKERDRIMYEKY